MPLRRRAAAAPRAAAPRAAPRRSYMTPEQKYERKLQRAERRRFVFSKMGQALGGVASTVLAPALTGLGSVSHRLGESAGNKLLSKVTGLGDYTVKYNTLAAHSEKLLSGDAVPEVRNTYSGVRICHREFIQDVSSTTAFNNITFNINPGISSTFPWLSAVAQNFQQYRLHGMIFTYISTSADALNSTNTALGTVIMATNYNSSAAAFSSKSQMENNEFTTSSKPSSNIMHMIECDPKQTLQEGKFYVRTGALPANQDIKTYDVGLFQLGTVGSQAAAVVGELHVSYDIELMKPIDASATGVSGQVAHYYSNTNVSTSNYFGTAQVNRYDTIGLTLGAAVITFPGTALPGNLYQVMLNYGGTAANVAQTTLTLANCSLVTSYTAGTVNRLDTGGNNACTVYNDNFIIKISSTAAVATPATITISGGTLPVSPVMELIIVQLPAAFA